MQAASPILSPTLKRLLALVFFVELLVLLGNFVEFHSLKAGAGASFFGVPENLTPNGTRPPPTRPRPQPERTAPLDQGRNNVSDSKLLPVTPLPGKTSPSASTGNHANTQPSGVTPVLDPRFSLTEDGRYKYVLVAMKCGQGEGRGLDASRFPVPIHYIHCDSALRDRDCNDESTYLLRFFAEQRDSPMADIFIIAHAHDNAWHYSRPLSQAVQYAVQHTSENLDRHAYGGLTCQNWNDHFPPTRWPQARAYPFRTLWNDAFVDRFPQRWLYPCCGTFFFHASLLKRRAQDEYYRIRENLLAWTKRDPRVHKDRICGRVIEGAWHVLLTGNDTVPIPRWCPSVSLMK